MRILEQEVIEYNSLKERLPYLSREEADRLRALESKVQAMRADPRSAGVPLKELLRRAL